MKAETKKARLAALLGIDLPKPKTKAEIQAAGTVSREAEAVILFGMHPKQFIQKECAQCGLVFAVNRTSIAVCSDECRKHYLWFKYKIVWDPNARSVEERWQPQTGGPEPLVVPPAVLPTLVAAVQAQENESKVESPLPQQSESLVDLAEFDVV